MQSEKLSRYRFPIIPAEQLKKAGLIHCPEYLSIQKLAKMHARYRTICEANGFIGLAGTQVPNETYRNTIFLNGEEWGNANQLLLINPVCKKRFGAGINVEGCGSINEGKTGFIVERPIRVVLDGFKFHPELGLLPIRSTLFTGEAAFVLDHEFEHLEGKSILSNPHKIISPLEPATWTNRRNVYQTSIYEIVVLSVQHNIFQEWLIVREGKVVKIPNSVMKKRFSL